MFHWTTDKSAQILQIGIVSAGVGLMIATLTDYCGFRVFHFLWTFGSACYILRSMKRINPAGKAVLITGCDTGIGHRLAFHLDKLGFRVFAACLKAKEGGYGAKRLVACGSKKIHVIQLDVTIEKELREAKEMIEKILPQNECLWGIVNNAGTGTYGNMEWVPVSEYKRIADVNVFGMTAAIKTFLPLIRKSKGRIVNTASALGRISAPLRSAYVASKFAVEGLSDCLRSEVKPLGINVCIIEPANFVAATKVYTPESVEKTAAKMWGNMSAETRESCGEELFQKSLEIMKTFAVSGSSDITPVLIAMEEALTQKYPQPRYQVMGPAYKIRIFIYTHFPEWIYEWMYGSYLEK